MMRSLRLPAIVVSMALCSAVFGEKEREKSFGTEVQSGPTTMSEEEKALKPDPAGGSEHGIVLLIESDRQEESEAYNQHAFHIRAKVFSNEARDLANVEIWLGARGFELEHWWGRTIQPDGTVLELPESELKMSVVAKVRRERYRVLKGALPGVLPGSIIDYGYVIRDSRRERGLSRWWTVSLQRAWTIRELRYTWDPWEYNASGFVVSRARGLEVESGRSMGIVKVTGKNLPPVKEEPWMPAVDSVKASATFFYFSKDENPVKFWTSEARQVSARVDAFLTRGKLVREAVKGLGLAKSAPLEEKLHAAYDWIWDNIGTRPARTGEGVAAIRDRWGVPKGMKAPTAESVLKAKEGTDADCDLLFIGMARELGAEANIVLAADRTDHYWNRSVLSMSQFDESVVAVRPKGTPAAKSTIVDPGSGLPWGQVPWWITGSKALLATGKGAVTVPIPFSAADKNVAETRVKIEYDDLDGFAKVRWSRTGSGNNGFGSYYALHRVGGNEREEKLRELCGESAAFEVERAEMPELEGRGARLSILCEGTMPEEMADEAQEEHLLGLDGSWLRKPPELTERKRTHPILFSYARVDRTIMEVSSPPGFQTAGPVESTEIDNPFGAYILKVEETPGGYRVDRTVVLPHTALPPDRYPGLRRFLGLAHKADRMRLSFVRAAEGS